MRLRTRLLIVQLIAGMMVFATGGAAMAVHDLGLFELDGNIVNGGAPGDDWVNLDAGGGGASLLAFTHVDDGDSPADTSYLHTGGSKDIEDFSAWVRTTTDEAPDKDEILNAFAAAYLDGGDLIIYFAADRYAQNGTAQVGFWFTQDDVSISGTSVLGNHEVGDILILSDFVNGGMVPVVRVFEWVGSGGSDGPIDEITVAGAADCAAVGASDKRCAIVNSALLEDVPWAYTPKQGDAQTYPAGAFYEGGINLTDLGITTDCFSTFIAETRTSAEPTARLKDIALGDFDTCASIAGMKFEDMNANGVKNAADGPLEGWQIHLFGNGVHEHDTTDANGRYKFEGLEPGTYTICEQQQAGWTQSAPSSGANCAAHGGGTGYTVTVGFGEHVTGKDFGNWRPATKSGTKFEDADADGVRDAGEPGLSGWTIYVDYDDDGVLDAGEPSAVTGADGAYTITGITPGSYKVREVQQAGWTCSYPSPCYHAETFTSGASLTGNDFGNWRTATKSGTKFEDLDADGVRDAGEPGLAGWTIYVDYNDNGQLDAGEPSAETVAGGAYLIGNVNPGTWKVREVQKAGWTCSYPSPCHHTDTFGSGQAVTNNDFGNWRPASKSGMKFEDLDADGVKDGGEPGLEGWRIYVDYNDNRQFDEGEPSALTGADGSYTITGITPGTYKVREREKGGWSCSYPSPCYYEEAFTSGVSFTGNDFGNWRPATKSGTKFEDADADGVRDAGEPGLSGWTIYVDYDDDGVLDAGEPSAVTGADGAYTITGITPGSYKVREVQQAGWTCSYPSPCYHAETFTSGASLTGNDFGNWRTATKSGTKFEDLDADGVRDAGEPGLAGWTIYVDYDDDGVHDAGEPSAVTNGDGAYLIGNVNPGTWKVREVLTGDWVCSYPSPCHHTDTFGSGQAVTGNDFGNWSPASKEGTKFEDLDADGVRDEGEPGLEGWTIFVDYDGDGVHDEGEPFDVTDADGSYTITGITPGAYQVLEVLSGDWVCSHPSPCRYDETFTSRAQMTGNDFGNWAPGQVSGAKFEDLDADGNRDEGEPGLEGWTIFVDYDGDGVHDDGEPFDVTGADGSYTITGIVPGSFDILEIQQEGWTCSHPSECDHSEDFVSRSVLEDRDFGNFRGASKSGTKWNDLDRDGVRDLGEPGLAGWEITLVGTTGGGAEVSMSTTTDINGDYSFDVVPGNYTVCENLVDNTLWVQTFPVEGADCGENGVGYAITLSSGEPETGNDFGNFLPLPAIDIEKTADPLISPPGTTITYTYVVTNTGEVDLFDVVVTDDILGQIGDPIPMLAVGESVTLTATAVNGTAPITNVGTVVGSDVIGRTVTDSDDAQVFPILGEPPITGYDPHRTIELGFTFLGLGIVVTAIARRRGRREVDAIWGE